MRNSSNLFASSTDSSMSMSTGSGGSGGSNEESSGEDGGSQVQGQNVPFSHMGIQALAQMMMNRPFNFQKNNGDNVRGEDEEDYRQEIEVVLSPPNPNPA
ncbi:hypothetical protein ACHAWC_008178, partial [Mediolabrus comicus]